MKISDSDLKEILLLADQYRVGERIPRLLCPVCSGGRSNERSLSITRVVGGLFFRCYRATCGVSGHVRYNSGTPELVQSVAKFAPNVFDYATQELEYADICEFSEHYGLSGFELFKHGIVKCPERNSFVIPIINILGYRIGTLERWFKWQNDLHHIQRKAKYYKETEEIPHYVPEIVEDTVVIVEDVLSAIKCSRYVPAVALLGTTFSSELQCMLHDYGVNNIIIALDPDMRAKSIRWAHDLRCVFDNVRTVFLWEDPKDTPAEDLKKILEEKLQ